jgi:hypothetical protein
VFLEHDAIHWLGYGAGYLVKFGVQNRLHFYGISFEIVV